MATITIMREKRFIGSFASWNVAVGGQPYGTISNGQTLQIQVPPGRYAVSVSKRQTNMVAIVDATDATPAAIWVRPLKASFLTYFAPLIWILVNRTRLIEMHVPGQPAQPQPQPVAASSATFPQPAAAQGWPGYPQQPHTLR